MYLFRLLAVLFLSLFLFSCNSSEEKKEFSENKRKNTKEKDVTYRNVSQEFKDYWYSGKAEITSYNLSQERYGEIRKGKAVNIFVSENFLPKEQVKADNVSKENISVLKLNQTKNFNTGIYPYSVQILRPVHGSISCRPYWIRGILALSVPAGIHCGIPILWIYALS